MVGLDEVFQRRIDPCLPPAVEGKHFASIYIELRANEAGIHGWRGRLDEVAVCAFCNMTIRLIACEVGQARKLQDESSN